MQYNTKLYQRTRPNTTQHTIIHQTTTEQDISPHHKTHYHTHEKSQQNIIQHNTTQHTT